VYLAREIIKIEKNLIWDNILEKIYGIKFEEFEKVYEFVKT
jgi:hypothetical protein